MQSSVLRQIAGGREGFGAKLTPVGLLPSMSSGVSFQYLIAGEGFVTQIALEFILGEV